MIVSFTSLLFAGAAILAIIGLTRNLRDVVAWAVLLCSLGLLLGAFR